MTTTNGQVKQSKDVEEAVRDRYARGASEFEPGLCCPEATYDPDSLTHLPEEIAQIDYGCGDPSKHVREGETVLDLGSGSGKICYILAKKVGHRGHVIGVDFNDAMLNLPRKHQDEVARRLGYANVSFFNARIQDLALDLERVQRRLDRHPLRSLEDVAAFEYECEQRRRYEPLIPDESIDVIVSNCVLNIVRQEEKQRLFREMHRVLKRGGRAVISDIVCDEDPTPEIMSDPDLWSGCIAGASFTLPALLLVTAAMAVGGLVQSRRIAQTMSLRITDMNTGQGLTANMMTSGLVLGASSLGMPVSTTHISCGSIFGIGIVRGSARWKTISQILATWLTTLPAGVLFGALFGFLLLSDGGFSS